MSVHFRDTESHWQTAVLKLIRPHTPLAQDPAALHTEQIAKFQHSVGSKWATSLQPVQPGVKDHKLWSEGGFAFKALIWLFSERVPFWPQHQVQQLHKFSDMSSWFRSSASWFIYFLQSEPLEPWQTYKRLLYCSFPFTKAIWLGFATS